ncbi:MarR family winged helix-turn-helix transcriptional regulator [Nitratireductor sp. L1-7-SE]|uniref:MarR family winged helix-turn-helix transcriptional regulator n=2 Tax=Nitratireductor rhodophyticola TaxID=2854036 RepID=A0ABS7R283_9HYPH|nr:MarR family winged helix-turn-helix transcriptional regulator [Nitratireductor rhodophyticola]MBY8919881.1 MarR family winged helix-turn-helix transcriptional regulator [Nitratireductor rhodophyticola]
MADCLLLNTVMAARAMTRRYDERLKPYGVSVIQFSVLMVLRAGRDEPVSRMAERVAMDRTTLLRNLELLVRRGLVRTEPALKGNGRRFLLSGKGAALVEELVPHWRSAQAEVRALLGEDDSERVLAALKQLTAGQAD